MTATYNISLLLAAAVLGEARGAALRVRVQERMTSMRRKREAYLMAANALTANDPQRVRATDLANWAANMAMAYGAILDGDAGAAHQFRGHARRFRTMAKRVSL